MYAVDNAHDVMLLYVVVLGIERHGEAIVASFRHGRVLHRLYLALHRQHLEAFLLQPHDHANTLRTKTQTARSRLHAAD